MSSSTKLLITLVLLPFLEIHAYTNEHPLVEAAKKGQLVDVKALLNTAGMDVNAVDNFGQTALKWATQESHEEIVQVLINAKADVNAADDIGWTPLMSAAFRGNTQIVQALIDAGANVDALNTYGEIALRAAAWAGHTQIVQILIDAGANVNASGILARIIGETPLMWAIRRDYTEISQNLVANGGGIDFVVHPVLCARYLLQST